MEIKRRISGNGDSENIKEDNQAEFENKTDLNGNFSKSNYVDKNKDKESFKSKDLNTETFMTNPIDQASISIHVEQNQSVSINEVLYYDKNSGINQTFDCEQVRHNLDDAFRMIQPDNYQEFESNIISLGHSLLDESNPMTEGNKAEREQFTKVIKGISFKSLLHDNI